MQYTLRYLDGAYKKFFKKQAQFPRFKSKKSNIQSFSIANISAKVEDKKLKIAKFQEGIKFNRKLPEYEKINKIIITRKPNGKYYASLSVEAEVKDKKKTGKNIGIDLGLKDFVIFSNGKKIQHPKILSKYEKELAIAQKYLSRKKKGSNRRDKQRQFVASIHDKIANCRKDFLHKVSARLVEDYDIICIEDLVIKNLVKNHKLAKVISDSSWSTFINFLKYKTEWYGKRLMKVDRFFPSSKTCNKCGWINQGLRLEDRKWQCKNCNTIHDRDINAAKNILVEGLRIIGTGIADNRHGENVRPKLAIANGGSFQ